MSEFICPGLISTDLAGRIFFLMAPCCDSEVLGGGGGEGEPGVMFLQANTEKCRADVLGGREGALESSLYFVWI